MSEMVSRRNWEKLSADSRQRPDVALGRSDDRSSLDLETDESGEWV